MKECPDYVYGQFRTYSWSKADDGTQLSWPKLQAVLRATEGVSTTATVPLVWGGRLIVVGAKNLANMRAFSGQIYDVMSAAGWTGNPPSIASEGARREELRQPWALRSEPATSHEFVEKKIAEYIWIGDYWTEYDRLYTARLGISIMDGADRDFWTPLEYAGLDEFAAGAASADFRGRYGDSEESAVLAAVEEL